MTKKLKIAFQGEPGANSHIAIVEAYPDAEPLPCATFEDALSAISSGEADLGMIPIENSVAGRVADIHHLLPASGLFIVGEWFLPIRHQLMAVARAKAHRHQDGREPCPRARPVPPHHPQARHQADRRGRYCRQRARCFRAQGQARAPRSPRALPRKSTASISWPKMSRTRPTTPRASWCWRATQKWATQGSGPLVTTFVFRVRNLPAALYKALGGFATNGVNMTKLESYMVDGEFSATQFYADVDGHPEDKGLAFALEELKFFSREFRIVGVYPAHPFRATFSEKAQD